MGKISIAIPQYSKVENGEGVSWGISGPYLGDLVWEEIEKITNGEFELDNLKFEKVPVIVRQFPDKAGKTVTTKSIRKSKLYLIHPCYTPHDTHCATAKRIATESHYSDVKEVNLVEPYNSSWRQDKREEREPLDARRVANEYQNSGINRVFAFDVHCPQISLGFSHSCPLENMNLSGPLIKFIKNSGILNNEKMVMAFPDRGAFKNYNEMAKTMHLDSLVLDKDRESPEEAKMNVLLPMGKNMDLSDSTVIIRDDEFSTGGTLSRATKTLKEDFNVNKVFACVTHLKLSMLKEEKKKEAINNIIKNDMNVITTNTVPLPKNLNQKVKKHISVLPIQRIIADMIIKREKGQVLDKFFEPNEWVNGNRQ